MKQKNVKMENYLERCPIREEEIQWFRDKKGLVTLEMENTGFFHRMAQKFLNKPKVSYIHLDEMGSFVWFLIDGEKDIIALGDLVQEQFGEKAEPLYERLAKYFQILESYSFIGWK